MRFWNSDPGASYPRPAQSPNHDLHDHPPHPHPATAPARQHQHPPPSSASTVSSDRRRLMKTNHSPLRGSPPNSVLTTADKPSNERRMSVGCVHNQMQRPGDTLSKGFVSAARRHRCPIVAPLPTRTGRLPPPLRLTTRRTPPLRRRLHGLEFADAFSLAID